MDVRGMEEVIRVEGSVRRVRRLLEGVISEVFELRFGGWRG